MSDWNAVYNEILEAAATCGCDLPFFRGHSDAAWQLKPTLSRVPWANKKDLEKIAYFDFVTRAGSLLPENLSSWSVAFAMQHHGLPTRLLDWTENCAAAIYFAVASATTDSCLWILNPFELNKICFERNELIRPQDLRGDYSEYFIQEEKKPEGLVMAVSPLRHIPRVLSQRAAFTVHSDLEQSLEEIAPSALKKILIPASALLGARRFLRVAGISEFALFPDLDGLARELNHEVYKR